MIALRGARAQTRRAHGLLDVGPARDTLPFPENPLPARHTRGPLSFSRSRWLLAQVLAQPLENEAVVAAVLEGAVRSSSSTRPRRCRAAPPAGPALLARARPRRPALRAGRGEKRKRDAADGGAAAEAEAAAGDGAAGGGDGAAAMDDAAGVAGAAGGRRGARAFRRGRRAARAAAASGRGDWPLAGLGPVPPLTRRTTAPTMTRRCSRHARATHGAVRVVGGVPGEKAKSLRAGASRPPARAAELALERCMRFVPQDQDTGGFFVAVLRKRGTGVLAARARPACPTRAGGAAGGVDDDDGDGGDDGLGKSTLDAAEGGGSVAAERGDRERRGARERRGRRRRRAAAAWQQRARGPHQDGPARPSATGLAAERFAPLREFFGATRCRRTTCTAAPTRRARSRT